MLNYTPATVTPGNAVADVDAAQAAMRPLAGFGAGAFACGSAWVGSRVSETAAALALPRIRRDLAGISLGHAQAGGPVGGAYEASLAGTKQSNQMTRVNPVTPGGVGPHPAREPDPV
jgi:hypothetical protein